MTSLLSIRGLTVRLGAGTPVDGVDLDVAPGETLGIVGESGSGKSLSLRAVLRLLPKQAQTTGTVMWGGQDLLTLPEPAMREVRGGRSRWCSRTR
ncbi:MAG: ATP-binding cassette domain-containing protein [Acetobacteraceae bacterium]